MHKERDDIGELFANKFEHFEMEASPNDWSNLKIRLAWLRFIRFNATQFNVYYLVTAILLIFLLVFQFSPDFKVPAEFTPVDKNQTHKINPAHEPESVAGDKKNTLSPTSGQSLPAQHPELKVDHPKTYNQAPFPAALAKPEQENKPLKQDSLPQPVSHQNDTVTHRVKRVKKTILIRQQQVVVKDTIYITK